MIHQIYGGRKCNELVKVDGSLLFFKKAKRKEEGTRVRHKQKMHRAKQNDKIK